MIGRVIGHGEFVEVSVTGGHEDDAAETVLFSESLTAIARHGAGATVGSGAGSNWSDTTADWTARSEPLPSPTDCAVRPEPPVSSTLTAPSETRVKVNFGQTFNDESNELPDENDIVPVEALTSDKLTRTVQASEPPPEYVTVIALMPFRLSAVIAIVVLPGV